MCISVNPARGRLAPLPRLVAMWIEQVTASATWPLRQKVLRPWLTVADVGLPGDADPGTVHLAVLDDSDTVVCTLRLHPQECPWRAEDAAWQLRSMATDPAQRGTGLGTRLVAAAVSTVAEAGGRLLWCNAREGAEGFYLRCGFTAVEERWQVSGIGPHVGMLRFVP